MHLHLKVLLNPVTGSCLEYKNEQFLDRFLKCTDSTVQINIIKNTILDTGT